MELSYSQAFFELSSQLDVRKRSFCLKEFLKKISILPFALFFKIYKTFFRLVGVGLSGVFVALSLGLSVSAREWFVLRITEFAKDLSDWFLWPLSILAYLIRLILSLLRVNIS